MKEERETDCIIRNDNDFALLKIETSSDGSSTIFVPGLDEHYHSVHGARNESMHVFIDAGLKQIKSDDLKILEIGMGTGLNALLTLSHRAGKTIDYQTIEKYPLPPEIYRQLNYGTTPDEKQWLMQIHESKWNEAVAIDTNFTLTKIKGSIHHVEMEGNYNLVYYDAFAPDKQPDMWQRSIFEKIFESMSPGGVMVTYCSKGEVRRMLQSIGFMAERIPGPPFKRHMLYLTKPA